MTVNSRQTAQAVQAMVVAATGRSCGYSTIPTTASLPTGSALPYFVLYELGQVSSGPPFGDANADARLLFQVTTVAQTPDACSAGADKVRAGFLGRTTSGWTFPINVPDGLAVMGRELDREDGMTVVASNYSYVQRFAVLVTTTS
ncbi:hypothetical protein [Streptomyces beijiangensis]|uniref:DUF3168 domain-containing protein n=1 Tax=Streptomyces beijiangensis TaxID=163361 RepID=A0A939FC88_9ACTN|nr:hypothetical protein [Streptomyces beijiangensis]MBO0514782.1 hypothetical protein [Streptomyces beijiangensis]